MSDILAILVMQIEHMKSSGMFSWLRGTGGAAVLGVVVDHKLDAMVNHFLDLSFFQPTGRGT